MSSMPSATIEAAAARVLAFGRQRLARYPECSNIASPIGLAQYLAIAAEVAAWTGPGRILDWGAGWGQTSLLLRANGTRVVAYDIEDKGAASGLLRGTDVRYVVTPGPELPFAEGEFDADACTVECPRHGSLFDLESGRPKTLPAFQPVDKFEVSLEDGEVKLDY